MAKRAKASAKGRASAKARPSAKAREAQPFDEVFTAVGKRVKKVFPKAKPVEISGMKGWKVARPASAPRPAKEGTMPSDLFIVLLADRAAGPTIHLWYPGDYHWLTEHGAMLKDAGFKVQRACLPYARKAPYPIDAIETLLQSVKERDAA